jgi:hypothetical protein
MLVKHTSSTILMLITMESHMTVAELSRLAMAVVIKLDGHVWKFAYDQPLFASSPMKICGGD